MDYHSNEGAVDKKSTNIIEMKLVPIVFTKSYYSDIEFTATSANPKKSANEVYKYSENCRKYLKE